MMNYLIIMLILSIFFNVNSEIKSISQIKIKKIEDGLEDNDKYYNNGNSNSNSNSNKIKTRIYEWLEKKKVLEWLEKKRKFEILDDKEYNEYLMMFMI